MIYLYFIIGIIYCLAAQMFLNYVLRSGEGNRRLKDPVFWLNVFIKIFIWPLDMICVVFLIYKMYTSKWWDDQVGNLYEDMTEDEER